jgi:hypothetical protein
LTRKAVSGDEGRAFRGRTPDRDRLAGEALRPGDRQTFGYHNSPSVKDDQPRDFYEETDDLRNERAWIEEMEDRPGWFTGDNSPIALTFGLDSSHCAWVRNTARLRDRVLLSDAPAPDTWYCYLMFDHGDSGC